MHADASLEFTYISWSEKIYLREYKKIHLGFRIQNLQTRDQTGTF